MNALETIQQVFFQFLMTYRYDGATLDYSGLKKHSATLQVLADIGKSGTGIFDISQKNMLFYSSNFGELLGYQSSDYEEKGQLFFAEKIHPEDAYLCCANGISIMKIFNNLSDNEKLNHKSIIEYRMLNAEGHYVRLIEQYQVLELAPDGQLWLMFNIVELSPNQEDWNGFNSQFLNFRTGKTIPLEPPQSTQIELTRREVEVLKLVKDGLMSKEISDKLFISVHTVNTHRQRCLEKLGASNSMEAVMFAARFGLLA